MKKAFLFLAIASLLLIGCNKKSSNNSNTNTENNSSFTTDDDPTSDVSDGGTPNEYDSESFTEEDVDVPTEFDGSNVTNISNAGKYYLSGEFGPVSITAKKNSVVYLFLDGASISSSEGIALGSENKITLFIILLNKKVNTITNNFEDANSLHIKGDLHILGDGTLQISSEQKNALKVSKDLYITGENVIINATGANHAISARSIIANDATINVTAKGKDGLQLEVDSDVTEFTSEQGYARLKNVKFTSDTYGDSIQANTFVYISGGEYNLTTHGEFVPYNNENLKKYELETSDFKFIKVGETYQRVAKDEIRNLSSKYYALTQSVKGIKTSPIEVTDDSNNVTEVTTGDYEIYIAHGAKITVDSTDDCIHSNYGNVTVEESNLFLATYDDGVHADYTLNVQNTHIEVSSSYEALEGGSVTVDGSLTNLVLYSDDDGINAASEYTFYNYIYIKNGYIRVYASGDGLDANTALYLQGGTVIVEGPGQGNGSLDANKVYFQGGTVFACSTNGMRESMSASQNTFIYQGKTTIYANSKISIVDSNNNAIFSYTLKQSCTQIIFSSASLVLNGTYKIMSDSTTIATITQTSSLTSVGTSGGGGGFPPH